MGKNVVKKTSRSTKPEYPIKVGEAYLFRLATVYDLGRVVAIHDDCIELSDACWVADTGRFHECVLRGTISESEPFSENVVIFKGAIVDVTKWNGKIPYGVA